MISIVICCYNSGNKLNNVLNGIAELDICNINATLEVIVVNNNSSDDTDERARILLKNLGLNGRVVYEHEPGLIYARIRGVKEAKGELICFVDDDNILDRQYIKVATGIFIKYPHVGYLGGQSKLPENYYPVPEWFDKISHSFAVGRQRKNNGFLDVNEPLLWGAGLIIKKSIFIDIIESGYEFKLKGRCHGVSLAGDDSEICYLFAQRRWAGYYTSELKITHVISKDRFNLINVVKMYAGFGASYKILNELNLKYHEDLNSSNCVIFQLKLKTTLVYCVLRLFIVFSSFSLNKVERKSKIAFWIQVFNGVIK